MERVAFRIRLKEGMKEEYKKRHDGIWPEMSAMLDEAGMKNYSIWLTDDNQLFGYYELAVPREVRDMVLTESEVNKRWNKHMDGLIDATFETTGTFKDLEEMFYHK
ncbi:L-rhamnose mutarotase [bioreactor metagenome]|uniref:L-rhamnose mutarotase n=1 Tax=bioreactor metagenome TaxID=1076179 RepID=A0A645H883_9ZZZZ